MIQSIDLISINPNVRNGRPCLDGTNIEVTAIVIEHIVHQRTPGEIAADYRVSLAQVHAALAYYYAHKDELDTLMQERSRLASQYREQQLGNRRPPLPG